MKKLKLGLVCLIALSIGISCSNKKSSDEEAPEQPNTNEPSLNDIVGFGVLNKVKGIWNGSITSSTSLGNMPIWIVDFRPISENQISSKNELDNANDIFMSLFVVKHNNQYKIAFRNGGFFGGTQRVTYLLADSVSENTTQSYYRFSEVVKGKDRAYAEFIRKNDSLILKTYTNKLNTLPNSTSHMIWRAKLQDTTSANSAVTAFNFPKKTMTIDFSSVFTGQSESIYYSSGSAPAGDPYPESAQPYLGKTTVNYSFDASHTPNPTTKVMLIVMTQPLFSGMTPNVANFKYTSRYVTLPASTTSFEFNYMHPGTYYVYAVYDTDGNNTTNSGDWLSTNNTSFNLNASSTTTVATQINFTIP